MNDSIFGSSHNLSTSFRLAFEAATINRFVLSSPSFTSFIYEGISAARDMVETDTATAFTTAARSVRKAHMLCVLFKSTAFYRLLPHHFKQTKGSTVGSSKTTVGAVEGMV